MVDTDFFGEDALSAAISTMSERERQLLFLSILSAEDVVEEPAMSQAS